MATLTGNTIASTYTGLLSVSGAVGADTVEAVTDGAGTSTSLSLSQQRATITLGSGAADDFIVDGTTFVVEGDNNKVGIGTATPAKALHVVNSALVKGRATFTLTGAINVTGTNVNVPGSGTAYLTELSIGDDIVVSSETRTIASITNDTTATVTAAWGSDLANDASPDCNPAAFTVIRDTGAIGMVLDDDGNVGIGTAAPASHKLHIDGGAFNSSLLIQGSGTDSGITFKDNDGNVDGYIYSSGSSIGVLDAGGDWMLEAQNDTHVSLKVTGATKFKIDANSRISLSNNDSGTYNTVFGKLAGAALANGGDGNLFIGENAGNDVTTADYNIAIGYQAFSQATDDCDKNIVIGVSAMSGNIASNDVSECVAIGHEAMDGVLTSTATGTVGIGYQSLSALTSGAGNTAVGYQSLDALTDGNYNTAVGNGALTAFTGSSDTNNTAVGRFACAGLTFGVRNTSMGAVALYQDTNGSDSVAIGSHSLFAQNKTDGVSPIIVGNTAVGSASGYYNETGNNNTYVGYQAGTGTSGGNQSDNVGIGKGALAAVDENASSNTAVGSGAGASITDGATNVVIGKAAGVTTTALTTGGDCVIIGKDAHTSAGGASNQIVIGKGGGGGVTDDNSVALGNSSAVNVYCSDDKGAKLWCTNIDSSSDIRIKKNVEKVTIGLDFVNELNPVSFNMRKAEDWDEDLKKEQTWYKKNTTPRDIDDEENKIGFIAQEVKASLDKYGVDCDIYAMKDNDKVQSLDYSRFVVPLVKAVQELSAKVKALEDA